MYRAPRGRTGGSRYRNLINQRSIVVTAAGFVHAARHWPHPKAIVRCQPENLRARYTVQPSPEISLVEHHRHTVVNRSR